MIAPKIGDLYADRFEILAVAPLCKALDRETGASVLVRLPSDARRWPQEVTATAVARCLQARPIAGTRPVVAVGEGVVFADVPAPRSDGALPLVDAAECALQACEVAAEFVSLGFDGLTFDDATLAAGYLDGRPSVLFTVPAPDRPRIAPFRTRFFPRLGPYSEHEGEALYAPCVCSLLFDLAPDAYVRPPGGPANTDDGPAGLLARLALRRTSKTPANPHLARLSLGCFDRGEERPAGDPPKRLVDVGRSLAELIDTPEARARAEALAHRPERKLRYDWDAVAASGERIIAGVSEAAKRCVISALAEAHHQRASAAWARGDHELALRAVNRAIELERLAPYLVTRAVVLLALGRVGEARYAIDAAHEALAAHDRASARHVFLETPYVPDAATRARAFATRARVSFAEGEVARAVSDYEEALRSNPSSARYRASLAKALHRLGRDDEAAEPAREGRR